MAKKFLGEAGLGVLVSEIKKSADDKSLLDATLEGIASFDGNPEEVTNDNVVAFNRFTTARDLILNIMSNFFGQTLPPDMPSSNPDLLNWVNEQLDKPLEPEMPAATGRALLSNDALFIYASIVANEKFQIGTNGRLQYRDGNPGQQTWHDYNPVSEISAEEVTNKFA